MENKNEKKYTKQEQQRIENFQSVSDEMAAKGYVREDVTVSMALANIMAFVWVIPFAFIFGNWYYYRNETWTFLEKPLDFLLFFFLIIILIVVHELIHGLFWGLVAPKHFHSIQFGVLWSALTPYCTCLEPLKKSGYFIGSFMPFFLLGIIPSLIGVLTGSLVWLVVGLLMVSGAGGDLTVIVKMLSCSSQGKEMILMDHPIACGFVVFRK